jgi:hypothetical protein
VRRGLRLPIVGALLVVLTAVGCGGGDSGDTVAATKADFVKKADAVCAETQKKIESEFRSYVESRGGKEPKKASALAAAQAEIAEKILIPAKQQEAEELGALEVPSGSERQVKAIVDAFEEEVEETKESPELAVTEGTQASGKATKLAREYGLTSC